MTHTVEESLEEIVKLLDIIVQRLQTMDEYYYHKGKEEFDLYGH